MNYDYLVDRRTNECVYEIVDNKPKFHSLRLAQELRDGITIPDSYRQSFGNKTVIKLDDPQFKEAMVIYVRMILKNNNNYKWGSPPTRKLE